MPSVGVSLKRDTLDSRLQAKTGTLGDSDSNSTPLTSFHVCLRCRVFQQGKYVVISKFGRWFGHVRQLFHYETDDDDVSGGWQLFNIQLEDMSDMVWKISVVVDYSLFALHRVPTFSAIICSSFTHVGVSRKLWRCKCTFSFPFWYMRVYVITAVWEMT